MACLVYLCHTVLLASYTTVTCHTRTGRSWTGLLPFLTVQLTKIWRSSLGLGFSLVVQAIRTLTPVRKCVERKRGARTIHDTVASEAPHELEVALSFARNTPTVRAAYRSAVLRSAFADTVCERNQDRSRGFSAPVSSFLNLSLSSLAPKVELNVDMLDPLTFRVVERLIKEALKASSAVNTVTVSATSSSSGAKAKPSSGGHKKRRGSEGEARLKKQRT